MFTASQTVITPGTCNKYEFDGQTNLHGHPLQVKGAEKISGLQNHVIVCGAEESLLSFVEQLRRCDPRETPVVVLHPRFPKNWSQLHQRFKSLFYIQVGKQRCLDL